MRSMRARAPWLLMGGTLAFFALAFWPGHMSADSLTMIGEASGADPLSDHHAPLLVWLWSIGWPVGVRPGVILVLQVGAFLSAAYLLARVAFGRLGAAIVAVAVALSPPVFGNLGVLSRDVWFLDFLLLAFGCLALAVRRPPLRRIAIGAAVAFALLGLFARQNAAPAVVVFAIALAAVLLAGRLGSRRALRVGAIGGAGILGVGAALVLQVGLTKAVGAKATHPEQYVYLYDLAGLSLREGESLFPGEVYPSADLAPIDATGSIDSISAMVFGPAAPIRSPRPARQVTQLREAWLDTIEQDPGEYLDWRWDAWLRQIGVEAPGAWIYHPQIDPNGSGYEIALPALNDVATGYQELFADDDLNGGVLHRAWLYLVVALCAAAILFMFPGAGRVVGALALSSWTYQVGLFFGTMRTGWRFEFPVAAIALIAGAVAARLAIDGLRAERERDVEAPGNEALIGGEPAAAAREPPLIRR